MINNRVTPLRMPASTEEAQTYFKQKNLPLQVKALKFGLKTTFNQLIILQKISYYALTANN